MRFHLRRGRRAAVEDQFYYEHWSGFPGTPGAVGLYEGISIEPGQRANQHRRSKGADYWSIVAVILVRKFPPGTDRPAALDYERKRINANRWPWNDDGNPDFEAQAAVRKQLLGRSPAPIEWGRFYVWRAKVWSVRLGLAAGCALFGAAISLLIG